MQRTRSEAGEDSARPGLKPVEEDQAIQNQQRVNEEISANEVRLISEDGVQLGILKLEEAQRLAQEQDLDLVEVAPNAAPPVCRIMNFGKFKYEQQKKEQQARKRSHGLEIKELRLGRSIRTEWHDMEIKLRKAREFLVKGHRLNVFLQLRGREITHSEIGMEGLKQFAKLLEDVAKLDLGPHVDRRRISILLSPLPNIGKKKKPEKAKKTENALPEPSPGGEPKAAQEVSEPPERQAGPPPAAVEDEAAMGNVLEEKPSLPTESVSAPPEEKKS
ncbi:MAG: translation initiation factor IF-3 [Planctomycetota bacterium]